eukprot:gene7845-10652_t
MAPRVPKHVAQDLIRFVKRIEVAAHFWDTNSTSTIEFGRQMLSPKLKKINPGLEVIVTLLPKSGPLPILKAEFTDNTTFEMTTENHDAADLRYIFFQKVGEIEAKLELSGAFDGDTAEVSSSGKAGAKGGGKGAAGGKGGKK